MAEVAELKKTLGIGKEREMAQPAIETPILQSWNEMLNNLKELSTTTVEENIELNKRVNRLEEELQVWKLARSVAIDGTEREKRQHEEEKLVLRKRISVLESLQDSMVLCVLDGDGNIFADSLLAAGLEGGREAARNLTSGIWDYLKGHGYDGRLRCTFWLSIYFNRKGLQDTLVRSEVCTTDQFEAFLVGISQASPRFLLVDVGYGKEAADAKIKEYLQTYTRFPQTLKVFFGGGHDNGYLPTLTALENERLLDKIVLLTGYREVAAELKALNLPMLDLDNLFRSEKLPSSPASRVAGASPSTPMTDIAVFPPGLNRNSSPLTIDSVISNISNNYRQIPRRQIDPKLPLTRQNPPPCNEYYLLKKCPRGDMCKYGHDYELSVEQEAQLGRYAKNAACPAVRIGMTCTFGSRCIWGHSCPRGPQCFHFRQGKCWFKTAAAHGATEFNGETPLSPAQQSPSMAASTTPSRFGALDSLSLTIR